jgi:hypothetical protein
MRDGTLKVPASVARSPDPLCAACQYGKACRQSHYLNTGQIDLNHDAPGHGVSADQLEARTPGIIPTNKGSPTTASYRYCNFWIDHYS